MVKKDNSPPAPPAERPVLVAGLDVSRSRIETQVYGCSGRRMTAIGPILTREAPPADASRQRGTPPPARGARALTFTPQSYNAETRTVEAVFSAGAPVSRWFGTEVLAISTEAINLERVVAGLCPLLNSHNQWDIGAVLGRVTTARIDGGKLVGTIAFADTDAGRAAEGMVARGELLGISIGYIVRNWQLSEMSEDSETWTATSWELLEVSLVPVPADPSAGVRSASDNPAAPGANEEDEDMLTRNQGGGTSPAAVVIPPAAPAAAPAAVRSEPAPAEPAAPEPAPAARAVAVAVAVNMAAIRTAATNAGLGDEVTFELLERHEATPFTRETLMADIGRRFAERDAPAATVNRVSVTRDAGDTMIRGMGDAILHRLSPRGELTDVGRQFRHMNLLRMAEELLVMRGVTIQGLSPNEIAERSLTTTSDLPALMANGMNRRLRSAYEENQPSYQRWARRAPNAPNFKSIDVIQLSALPDLLKVNEGGEIKYGSISDGVVSYKVLTYARAIGITRQTIVNDDLRALERVTTGFAGSASRLENRTVYAQITSNPAMPDGKNLFDVAHGNLTAAAAAISAASLGVGRTSMRLQKGLQKEELNLTPSFLILPATQEQLAYQYTSANYVPAKQSDTNEFRAGGRTAVEPIVEAILDGVSTKDWYMAADSGQVDTVEYCYLDGAEGPQISSRLGFTVDGVEVKASLDFAAATIDWRGLYKQIGA